jgi:hypothetical protein
MPNIEFPVPDCPRCGQKMRLRMIVPAGKPEEHRLFECATCREESSITVASEQK